MHPDLKEKLTPNQFDRTGRAVLHVQEAWIFDKTVKEISNGRCEEFASAVVYVSTADPRSEDRRLHITGCEIDGFDSLHEKWGGHIWVYDSDTHLHYDSEAPRGVINWQNLPFFKRKTAV